MPQLVVTDTNTTPAAETTAPTPIIPADAVPYFKIARKLAINQTRAQHHYTYLATCQTKHQPPRGLQARVSPQIADPDWEFNLKWETAHQNFGIELTKILAGYYERRIANLNKEIEKAKGCLRERCTTEIIAHIEVVISNMLKTEETNLQERRTKKTQIQKISGKGKRRSHRQIHPQPL